MKILHRFLRSSAVAIKIVFRFNSTLIVGGSYFCHDDASKPSAGGRSLGRSGQFRSVCSRARSVADHAVLERTGRLLGPAIDVAPRQPERVRAAVNHSLPQIRTLPNSVRLRHLPQIARSIRSWLCGRCRHCELQGFLLTEADHLLHHCYDKGTRDSFSPSAPSFLSNLSKACFDRLVLRQQVVGCFHRLPVHLSDQSRTTFMWCPNLPPCWHLTHSATLRQRSVAG